MAELFKVEGDQETFRFKQISNSSQFDKVSDRFDGVADSRVINQSDRLTVFTEHGTEVPFEAKTSGQVLRVTVSTHFVQESDDPENNDPDVPNPDRVLIGVKNSE